MPGLPPEYERWATRKRGATSASPRVPAAYIGFVSGTAAGVVDTIVNFPPYGLHYRLQRGCDVRPWSAHAARYYAPRELYRGVGAYAAIIPVTALADGVTHSLKGVGVAPLVAALAGGACSALLVSTPTGNIIIAQQQTSTRLWPAARALVRAGGVRRLWTGLTPLLGREGTYSAAVFWGNGAAAARLPRADAATAGWASAVLVGTVATAISQPMDALATAMQDAATHPGVRATTRRLYAEGGAARFYRGALLRGAAVISGVYFMAYTSERTKAWLERRS